MLITFLVSGFSQQVEEAQTVMTQLGEEGAREGENEGRKEGGRRKGGKVFFLLF